MTLFWPALVSGISRSDCSARPSSARAGDPTHPLIGCVSSAWLPLRERWRPAAGVLFSTPPRNPIVRHEDRLRQARNSPRPFSSLCNPPHFTDGRPHLPIPGKEASVVERRKDHADRPYLNTRQAAHRLGMSARKLEKMRGSGTGPRFRRHGRLVFYHIDDLETWSLSTAVEGAPSD